MSNSKLNGRVVAVTGATGEIGRAVVCEFAKRGGSIALLARGEVGLTATAAEATAAGATPMGVPVDVVDPFRLEEAAGVPGLLARYLARPGFTSQQTGQPKDPDQPANLRGRPMAPRAMTFGADGAFVHRAEPISVEVFAFSCHSALLGAAGAAGAGRLAAVGRQARK